MFFKFIINSEKISRIESTLECCGGFFIIFQIANRIKLSMSDCNKTDKHHASSVCIDETNTTFSWIYLIIGGHLFLVIPSPTNRFR